MNSHIFDYINITKEKSDFLPLMWHRSDFFQSCVDTEIWSGYISSKWPCACMRANEIHVSFSWNKSLEESEKMDNLCDIWGIDQFKLNWKKNRVRNCVHVAPFQKRGIHIKDRRIWLWTLTIHRSILSKESEACNRNVASYISHLITMSKQPTFPWRLFLFSFPPLWSITSKMAFFAVYTACQTTHDVSEHIKSTIQELSKLTTDI